jgi:transposase
MTVTKKIDENVMMQMFRDGKNTSQIARHFGCTFMAVKNMKKRVEGRLLRVPDVSGSQLSRQNIDTVSQLKLMNEHVLKELKRSQRLIDREDKLVIEYDKLEKQVKKDPTNNELIQKLKVAYAGVSVPDILKIQTNIIAISGEVRKQIELQVKIFETIYNVTMVSEFQEEIIELLRQVDPVLKDSIIKKLKERRSIRSITKME